MTINANRVRVEIGEIPKKKIEGIVYFESFEEMNKILTPQRVKLIETIKQNNPQSIYELAKLIKRDQGNVTKDINILEDYGFVTIEKITSGNRQKSKVTFEEDGIEMIIKLGAGAFGLGKEIIENVSDEFQGKQLEENIELLKQERKKAIKVIKKPLKKFYDKLNDEK